jgi:hypothetical protein
MNRGDTENVRLEDVPKSAPDFLNSRFKSRLISAYPADDDATLYVFGGIVRQYGWGYMDQYMKQQPKFVQGHLDVARSLGSGESLVSFDNTVSSTLDVQREGGKVALAGPTDDFLHAEAGGLVSYGPSLVGMWQQCAMIAVKILRGAKPGDLPVEQPSKLELVVNAKTAKSLGLTIPPALFIRADEVIE